MNAAKQRKEMTPAELEAALTQAYSLLAYYAELESAVQILIDNTVNSSHSNAYKSILHTDYLRVKQLLLALQKTAAKQQYAAREK